jgi:acylphosphatase
MSVPITAFIVDYHGEVQGVGFRYTVLRLAQRYAVTGYVKNMPDGTVHLYAEGTQAEIDALLHDIRHGPHAHYITEVQTQPAVASGTHRDFRIAF